MDQSNPPMSIRVPTELRKKKTNLKRKQKDTLPQIMTEVVHCPKHLLALGAEVHAGAFWAV